MRRLGCCDKKTRLAHLVLRTAVQRGKCGVLRSLRILATIGRATEWRRTMQARDKRAQRLCSDPAQRCDEIMMKRRLGSRRKLRRSRIVRRRTSPKKKRCHRRWQRFKNFPGPTRV